MSTARTVFALEAPAGGSQTAQHGDRGGTAIATPVPGVWVIQAAGPLNRKNSARLQRLIDTQLASARCGHLPLRAVIVDLAAVHRIDREGPTALGHARSVCGRLGVDFALAGMPGALYDTSVAVRTRLRGFSVFPTVDFAVDALIGLDPGDEPLAARANAQARL